MKKQIFMVGALLTTVITLIILLPSPAIASRFTRLEFITVRIDYPPENAVFADILIRIDERDPNFTAVNEDNLALFGLDTYAEIVGFNDNGFMSFTFHYIDASAQINLIRTMLLNTRLPIEDSLVYAWVVRFVGGLERQFHDLLANYSDMKIALLDYSGNVISVSAEFSLPRLRRGVGITTRGDWLSESVFYNHETGNISVHFDEWRYNYLGTVLRPIFFDSPVLFFAAVALFLMILELLIGLCFGFCGKKLILILPASLVALPFAAEYFLVHFHWGFDYFSFFLLTILLIAVTYIGKFFIYRKNSVMKDISTPKILRYTITASTLSLAFLVVLFLVTAWQWS